MRWLLVAAVLAAAAVELSAAASLCDGAKHPIVVLPGIMASQINASYNGISPGSPCLGRKKMHQIWPPSAKDILPTGFACWKYMIQLDYDGLGKTFVNNRGVKVHVESGGRSGTNYQLFQASYANLTNYLVHSMGYVVGKDLFGAPYDWRYHISGLSDSGQMAQLMARVENAVNNNCGKKAIVLGHSMGGLVATALLQKDPTWTQKYVKGLVTVSAPFGGTTDQAITVRMGAVEWNINEWVKNPISRVAKELQAHVQDLAKALEEDQLADVSIAAVRRVGKQVKRVGHIAGALAHHGKHHAAADGAAAADAVMAVDADSIDGAASSIRHLLHSEAGDAKPAAKKDGVVKTASGALPKPINNMVKNYISSAFYKVTMGLPGLSMLLPYPSAYGAWRRIVVTRRKTYTASMMKRLMADMGDSVTSHAWSKVQELDKVLAAGPIPGVASYCMYGHLLDTTLTWNFPNVQENKPALTATPLVTTSGDGTVSVQSLKQCYKITSNITELGAYGHLEVLKNKATLAQLREIIREIASNPDVVDATKPSEPPRQPNWPSQTPDDQLANDPNAPIPAAGGDNGAADEDSSYAEETDDYNDPWELEVDRSGGSNSTGSTGGRGSSGSDSSSGGFTGGNLKLIDPSDLKHAPNTINLPTPKPATQQPAGGAGAGGDGQSPVVEELPDNNTDDGDRNADIVVGGGADQGAAKTGGNASDAAAAVPPSDKKAEKQQQQPVPQATAPSKPAADSKPAAADKPAPATAQPDTTANQTAPKSDAAPQPDATKASQPVQQQQQPKPAEKEAVVAPTTQPTIAPVPAAAAPPSAPAPAKQPTQETPAPSKQAEDSTTPITPPKQQPKQEVVVEEDEEDPDWTPAQALPLEYYQQHPELLLKPKNMRVYKWLLKQQKKGSEEEEQQSLQQHAQPLLQKHATDMRSQEEQNEVMQQQRLKQQPAPSKAAQQQQLQGHKLVNNADDEDDAADGAELSDSDKLESLLLSLGEGDLLEKKRKEKEEQEAKERLAREAKEKLEKERQEREAQAKAEREQQQQQKQKDAAAAAAPSTPTATQQPAAQNPAPAKQEVDQQHQQAKTHKSDAAVMINDIDSWPSFKASSSSSSSSADDEEAEEDAAHDSVSAKIQRVDTYVTDGGAGSSGEEADLRSEESDDKWEPSQRLSAEFLERHPELKWKAMIQQKSAGSKDSSTVSSSSSSKVTAKLQSVSAAGDADHEDTAAATTAKLRSFVSPTASRRTSRYMHPSVARSHSSSHDASTADAGDDSSSAGRPNLRHSVPKLSQIARQSEQHQHQQAEAEATTVPSTVAPAPKKPQAAATPAAATPATTAPAATKPAAAQANTPAPAKPAASTPVVAAQPAKATAAAAPAKPAAAPVVAAAPKAAPAAAQPAAAAKTATVAGAATDALTAAKRVLLDSVEVADLRSEESDDKWEPSHLSAEFLQRHPELKWKAVLKQQSTSSKGSSSVSISSKDTAQLQSADAADDAAGDTDRAAAKTKAKLRSFVSPTASRRTRYMRPRTAHSSSHDDSTTAATDKGDSMAAHPTVRHSVPKLSQIARQNEQHQHQQAQAKVTTVPSAMTPAPKKPQAAAAPAAAAPAATKPAASTPVVAAQPAKATPAAAPAKPAAAPVVAAAPKAAPAAAQSAATAKTATVAGAAADALTAARRVLLEGFSAVIGHGRRTLLEAGSSSSNTSSNSAGGVAADTPNTEALPPKALFVPKPVSVLPDDVNPLASQQYQLVGPPRSVALGAKWAHEVFDVASGACLEALAKGEKAPPGCI